MSAMDYLDSLSIFFLVPYYPATLLFFVACIRRTFWRKDIAIWVTPLWALLSLLPSLLGLGLILYDFAASTKYDQHLLSAIVVTYFGAGILINLVSGAMVFYNAFRKSNLERSVPFVAEKEN